MTHVCVIRKTNWAQVRTGLRAERSLDVGVPESYTIFFSLKIRSNFPTLWHFTCHFHI